MAVITLTISIPDDDEYVIDYGSGWLGEEALEYLSGWRDGYGYVSSSEGPDEPRLCGACGHASHRDDDLSYRPCCDHPLCEV